jgi:hypothetical protein
VHAGAVNPTPRCTAMEKLRIGTIRDFGRQLTRPFRDARRFPSTRLYRVPRATRTRESEGIVQGPFSVPRAKPQSSDSQLFHRCRMGGRRASSHHSPSPRIASLCPRSPPPQAIFDKPVVKAVEAGAVEGKDTQVVARSVLEHSLIGDPFKLAQQVLGLRP